VSPIPANPKDNFELFEWFMAIQKTTPRANILAWFSPSQSLAELEALSDEDLRIAYCEALVAAMEATKAPPDAT
jgi:hypothetical protein